MVIKEKDDILGLLGRGQKILITTKASPEYDEVAAACAARFFIREFNPDAQVDLAVSSYSKNRFRFIPGAEDVKNEIQAADNFIIQIDITKTKVKEMSYDKKGDRLEIRIKPHEGRFTTDDISFSESSFAYDLIIVFGADSLASVGELFDKNRELFFNTPIINIDRKSRNARYGQINAVYITATSLSEIVWELMDERAGKEVAACLLTGLIAATNSFQSPQVTPDTLQLASKLIVAGAPRDEIVSHLYRTKDMGRLQVWGRILSRLRHVEKKIVYSDLREEEVRGRDIDLPSLVDDLVMASPEADIVLFFYETGQSETRVYAYARENYDLLMLLHSFNPRGSGQNVEFTVRRERDAAEREVLDFMRDRLKMVWR